MQTFEKRTCDKRISSMKEWSERENRLFAGLSATAKSAISIVPGFGQAIAVDIRGQTTF